MRLLPSVKVFRSTSIVGDLASKGLQQKRMSLEAVKQRQKLSALAGSPRSSPKFQRVIIREARKKVGDAARARIAASGLQRTRIEPRADQNP